MAGSCQGDVSSLRTAGTRGLCRRLLSSPGVSMSRLSVMALVFALACPTAAVAQKRAFTIEDLYRVKGVAGLAVSPDERSLVYAVSTTDLPRAKRTAKLWMSASDGTSPRQITFGTGNESDASFSPDGKWIAFVSTRDGSAQLYVMPTAGGEARKVMTISTGVSSPAWLPDSSAMVFASDVYPECGADDACNKKIAERWEGGPLKAHMADTLLYRHWTDWRDGKLTHLLRVDVTSGALRDLTPGEHDAPPFSLGGPTPFAVSPDGEELVFESKRVKDQALSTNNDLFAIALDGSPSEPKNLTAANGAFDGSPEFSPDGRYIAYRVQAIPDYESDLFRLALLRPPGGHHPRPHRDLPQLDRRLRVDARLEVDRLPGAGRGRDAALPARRRDRRRHEGAGARHDRSVRARRRWPRGRVTRAGRSGGPWRSTARRSARRRRRGSSPRSTTRWPPRSTSARPSRCGSTAPDGAKIHVFIVKPHGFDRLEEVSARSERARRPAADVGRRVPGRLAGLPGRGLRRGVPQSARVDRLRPGVHRGDLRRLRRQGVRTI